MFGLLSEWTWGSLMCVSKLDRYIPARVSVHDCCTQLSVQQDLCMFSPLPPNNASPTSQHLWDRRLRGQNDESGKSPHHETSV